jgi:FkbM family methyltransferase
MSAAKSRSPLEILSGVRHLSRAVEIWRCLRQSNDAANVIASYLGVRVPDYPLDFQTPYGDVMTLADFHDLVTAWILFYRREYRIDPRCRVIIDAGANIGAFTLLAARVAPASRVIALEPFPETRARLEGHLARNALSDRVFARPWALSQSDAIRHMNDACLPSQSRGLLSDKAPGSGVAVEAIRLTTLWEREGIDRVDLLKMDIEGAEHEVVLSTPPEVLRRARSIALEYHPNAPKGPLFARFREAGFRLVHDAPAPHGPDGGVAHFRLD